MPALVAGIHAFEAVQIKDVDGRDKPGHDEVDGSQLMSVGISSTTRQNHG
jgi:hypothetical protein